MSTNLGQEQLRPDRQDSVDSEEYRKAAAMGAMIGQQDTLVGRRNQEQTNAKQPSLAQSLRQRRELQEHMEQERALYSGNKTLVRGQKRHGTNNRHIPSQTDESGSAIRIRNQRPQTPRINLLKMSRQQKFSDDTMDHPLFSQQAQLPKSKPFNYLNPNAKIGITPIKNSAASQPTYPGVQNQRPSNEISGPTSSSKIMTVKQKSSPKKPVTVIKASAIISNNSNTNGQQEESKSGEKHALKVVKQTTLGGITPEQGIPEQTEDLNQRAAEEVSAFDFEATQSQNDRALLVVRRAHSESDYNTMALTNMQDQFMEIMNTEQVEDVIDLNEKFLTMALGGIEVSELALLPKLELRVDTTCHSLQVTGEILPSLEYLKLNDSIIRCFRDIGTSFKNVRVLHIARCELTEAQGIQAFEQLEELYIAYNAIDDLFDISLCENLTILDFEGNNISAVEQIKYLRRMPRLADVNFKQNPVAKEFAYYQKLAEFAPKLQCLDDEPIGESFEQFVEEKQKESRKLSMQQSIPVTEQYRQALQSVLTQFDKLGLTGDDIFVNDATKEIESISQAVVTQMTSEPDEEALIVLQIKSQDKDQKAQQSYEDNMGVQGFGNTFASGFGMSQTATSGFDSVSNTSSMRPSSAFMNKSIRGESSANQVGSGNPVMTEGGDDDEDREQMEFEQSLRDTSMSFFKTAKSTFMSTNDLESKSMMNDIQAGFGGGKLPDETREDQDADGSDLAANTDQIVAGGTMSILRRKGKQYRGRKGNEKENIGRGAKFNFELLSGDIHTLLQVFHDEANGGDMRDRSASLEEPAIVRSKTLGSSSVKLRPSSNRKIRPSVATSLKDPKLAAVAQILARGKAEVDPNHRPVIGGTGQKSERTRINIGQLSDRLSARSNQNEKVAQLDKFKRAVVQTGTTAPTKSKLMTVKLKPGQIAFKSSETKVVTKKE